MIESTNIPMDILPYLHDSERDVFLRDGYDEGKPELDPVEAVEWVFKEMRAKYADRTQDLADVKEIQDLVFAMNKQGKGNKYAYAMLGILNRMHNRHHALHNSAR